MPGFVTAVNKNPSSIMPYYSKPAAQKSSVQQDMEGKDIRFDPYGFAYNKVFVHDILRGQMGFKGYLNSDTGIVHNMCWGVEALDIAERIGFAVNNAGIDVISGLYDNAAGKEAYERATNGYYDTHTLPEGITPEMVTLNDAVIDRAVIRTLTEMSPWACSRTPTATPRPPRRPFPLPSTGPTPSWPTASPWSC